MSVAIEICREAAEAEASGMLVGGLIVFALYIGADTVLGFLTYSNSQTEKGQQRRVFGV
jgi:hypothetical protein